MFVCSAVGDFAFSQHCFIKSINAESNVRALVGYIGFNFLDIDDQS